jgi:hypothetical protein
MSGGGLSADAENGVESVDEMGVEVKGREELVAEIGTDRAISRCDCRVFTIWLCNSRTCRCAFEISFW